MKRTLSMVFALMLACAAVLALSGCEQIGMGDEGAGVPTVSDPQVSSPTIAEDGVLRVGVNGANAPFSTLLGDKLVGIDVDIAAALADTMGLKVKIVDVGAEPETALATGTVDVIMGVDTSDSAATCWKSTPYIDTAVGLFATSSGAIMPTADSNPIIEAQESSMSAWEVTNQFGEGALKAVSDLRTAFEDLEAGNVVYVASDAIIGSYVTHTSAGRAMLIGLMQTPGGYCVGVHDKNGTLQTAIESAVSTLVGSGAVSVIESKWIGTSLSLTNMSFTNYSADTNQTSSSSSSSSAVSSVGKVGTNAVDLRNGSTATDESETTTTEQTDSGVTETAPAVDNTQTYVDPGTTYVDPAAGTGTIDNGGAVPVDPGTGGAAVDSTAAGTDATAAGTETPAA